MILQICITDLRIESHHIWKQQRHCVFNIKMVVKTQDTSNRYNKSNRILLPRCKS